MLLNLGLFNHGSNLVICRHDREAFELAKHGTAVQVFSLKALLGLTCGRVRAVCDEKQWPRKSPFGVGVLIRDAEWKLTSRTHAASSSPISKNTPLNRSMTER